MIKQKQEKQQYERGFQDGVESGREERERLEKRIAYLEAAEKLNDQQIKWARKELEELRKQ